MARYARLLLVTLAVVAERSSGDKDPCMTNVFRVGSGAPVGLPTPAPAAVLDRRPIIERLGGHGLPTAALSIVALTLIVIMMMMPSGGQHHSGNRDFNYRIPPSWSPEHESSYSFRAYMTDIALWIMLTDLQPHQQCAAIVMRLGGAAREMARMLTPHEMMHGGPPYNDPNGPPVDPVTFLLGALHQRFCALEEESRLTCTMELMAFARKPGENVNSLISLRDRPPARSSRRSVRDVGRRLHCSNP